MSKYLEKMEELTFLNSEEKGKYYSKMTKYRKSDEKYKNILDSNSELLFKIELEEISSSTSKIGKAIKNINLIVTIIFILNVIALILILLGWVFDVFASIN